jgi:WD40 repeat protein
VASGQLLTTFSGHQDNIQSVAFSPDGKSLVSSSWDNTANLWDVANGQLLNTLSWPILSYGAIVFSPDGKILASALADQTILLWDATNGQRLHTLSGHTGVVNTVAFSPDGQTLASGSDDNTIILWDVASGQSLQTLSGNPLTMSDGTMWFFGKVNNLAFSPDGQFLASGSSDYTLILWDVATWKAIHVLASIGGERTDSPNSIAFSPDGSLLASLMPVYFTYFPIQLMKVAGWEPPSNFQFDGHTLDITSLSFSPDGKTLASASRDQTIILWDVASGQPRRTLDLSYIRVRAPEEKILMAFSPDGKVLASGAVDGSIMLWDAASGQSLYTLTGGTYSLNNTSVAFSPDGKILASGSSDGPLQLWGVYP